MKACVLIIATLTIIVQKAQSNFMVQPVPVVQAEGLEAVFECLYPGASFYGWFVNGMINTDPDFPPEAVLVGPSGSSSVSLTIPAIPEYNNTVVQCRVIVEVDGIFNGVLSDNATLTVYGIDTDASAIGDTITLSWMGRPFTTSITYCVHVTQTFALTENYLLVSPACGLTETTFNFSYPDHGPCDRFNFTVTPTDGDLNGTSSQPAIEFFRMAKGQVADIRVIRGQMEKKNVTISLEVPDCYVPTQNYSVHNSEGVISAILENSTITFTFSPDSRETVTVLLTDSNGVQLVFKDISFRTNDIRNVTAANCSHANCVNVSLTFIEGSSSPGALVIVVPTHENGSLVHSSSVYMFLSRDMSEDNPIVVTQGGNKIFAFDVESNGTLREPVTYAAGTTTVDVLGDELTPDYPTENANIQAIRSMDGVVNVTIMDDSLIYLVIVHSINSPDKLHVRIVNTSIAQTVIITPEGAEDVYVVVFSWEQGQSFLNATTSLSSLLPLFQMSTSADTTSPGSDGNTTSSTTTAMSPNTQTMTSFVVGVVVGCLIAFVLIVAIIVVAIVVCVRLWKDRQRVRAKLDERTHYNQLGERNGSERTTRTTENNIDCPREQFYDLINPAGNNPSPSAINLLNMHTALDNDAPPLPPPYVPDVSVPASLTSPMYSEITGLRSGAKINNGMSEAVISQQIQYTQVESEKTTASLSTQPEDNTTVVYATVDKKKLAPKLDESEATPASPTRPPPMDAESLLSTIHSIAARWEEFGKALKIDEDNLDDIFTNNENNQLRLHELVQYYLMKVKFQHTWEEVVRALNTIGEYDCAQKIARDHILEDELPPYSSFV